MNYFGIFKAVRKIVSADVWDGRILDVAYAYADGHVTREELVLDLTGRAEDPEALAAAIDGAMGETEGEVL